MNKPVYLYKDGVQSNQQVYPADHAAWVAQGWTVPDVVEAPIVVDNAAEARAVNKPIYLYKDGIQSKQQVYQENHAAWFAQGWSPSNAAAPVVTESIAPLVSAQPEAIAPADAPVTASLDAEIARLQGVFDTRGWSQIKKEADALGVDKNEGGWEETIPSIAAAIVSKA